jgi:hypothetical protein
LQPQLLSRFAFWQAQTPWHSDTAALVAADFAVAAVPSVEPDLTVEGFAVAFNGHGFRGDRFRHRDFGDRFVFFGDFGDPFFYYPYPYYGYYPYGYYPYDYGYNSYAEPVYQGSAGYPDPLIGQVQLRLARAGYYHGAIDGVSGNATRRAIREYERAHSLPADGQIRGRLLTTMGIG